MDAIRRLGSSARSSCQNRLPGLRGSSRLVQCVEWSKWLCKERWGQTAGKATKTLMWKYFLHAFTLVWAHLGLWIGYMSADYNYDPYSLSNHYYYVWAKSLELMTIICLLNPVKYYKWHWLCFCLFMVIRLVWDIFAIQDYSTASRASIIFILFLINCACVILVTPIQLITRWLKNG